MSSRSILTNFQKKFGYLSNVCIVLLYGLDILLELDMGMAFVNFSGMGTIVHWIFSKQAL